MKKIQTFSNSNLERNRVAHIFETTAKPGMESIHKPTYEVSTHSGGIEVQWDFQSFKELEDAQQFAIQFIMPKGFLCKITG